MSNLILYSQDISPPCRAVLMVAHALGLKLEIREIDLTKKQQLSQEYRKVNPQHTIPVLDDNGFVLPDSHAIICYLVDKYGKDDALYPKELQKRALVHQFLHLDSGTLFPPLKSALVHSFRCWEIHRRQQSAVVLLLSVVAFQDYLIVVDGDRLCEMVKASFREKPVIVLNEKSVPEDKMKAWKDTYVHLNNLLEGKKWLVGNSYTLADISCVVTASSSEVLLNMDEFPNVKAWIQRCERELIGYKECNVPGRDQLISVIRSIMA